MAEVLNEFDREYPSSPFTCCRRISVADYDRQGTEETHSELEKLIDFVDDNPEVFYSAVRKRKRDELNLFPFVKVKVMTAVQGDGYLHRYFPEEQCKEHLDSWKNDLVAAYDFGQEAVGSGKRFSKRLAAKRKAIEAKKSDITIPPPPPPPPPPILPPQSCASKMNEEYTENINPIQRLPASMATSGTSSTSHFKTINEEYIKSIRKVTGRLGPSNSQVDITNNAAQQSKIKTVKTSLSNEITNARKKLKCINPQNSPGGTPYQLSKIRREARTTPEEYPMFNIALVHKFRNTRSPTPSPSGQFNSSSSFCESPY